MICLRDQIKIASMKDTASQRACKTPCENRRAKTRFRNFENGKLTIISRCCYYVYFITVLKPRGGDENKLHSLKN